MCGIKTTTPQPNYLEIDEWLEFEFPSSQIITLRKSIENLIEKKLFSPINTFNEHDETTLRVLSNILMIEERQTDLIIPNGIKQRPRFFELNRQFENNDTNKSMMHVETGRFDGFNRNNYYENPVPQFNRLSVGHLNNGQNVKNKGQMSFFNALECRASSSTSSSSTTSSFRGYGDYPNFDKSVFILIKVKQESSVHIAQETRRWVFAPQTEKTVVALDNVS